MSNLILCLRVKQASYGRREIEIAEQEMPGIMALRSKAKVRVLKTSPFAQFVSWFEIVMFCVRMTSPCRERR